MQDKLYIDVETYSDIDLEVVGSYKYCNHSSFEILLIGYAFNDEPIHIIDFASGDYMPERFEDALFDENVIKVAHNAMFERNSFRATGFEVPAEQWFCTMIKAAYCGLPMKLESISKVLDLENKKLDTGKALINYFTKPCKATITNGQRTRNMPHHNPEKWKQFREYLYFDVAATREIDHYLEDYTIPKFDTDLYVLDQKINDIGVKVDIPYVKKVLKINNFFTEQFTNEIYNLTGLENPNSVPQLKKWLSVKAKKKITSLTKESVTELLKETEDYAIRRVLEIRQQLGKTSNAKYIAMLNAVYGADRRLHGMYQYYGASQTGRWSSRMVQLHNLPQNHIPDLDLAREIVQTCEPEVVEMFYGDIFDTLSQLIRTAFIPEDGKIFYVSDFSAIESRVISWLAAEEWRLEVFRTHGKIYEATASKMFGVPLESIDKGSTYRQQGKVAELALGFGGSKDAITRMDRNNEIPDEDKPGMVRIWRKANPQIVKLWKKLNDAALDAVFYKKKVAVRLKYTTIVMDSDGLVFTIQLPSGRKLYYFNPSIGKNKFGGESVTYWRQNQVTKKWEKDDTYGGKIAENIVQGIARDLLAFKMLELDNEGYEIPIHVHDEAVVEHIINEYVLSHILEIMSTNNIPWAQGLPLAADGYTTDFYKKD